MSYDIYFTDPRISKEEFQTYFRGRPSYEVSDSQAVYQNEDTGVYFIFDYAEDEEKDPEGTDSVASFTLNYYRPHIFGLEAVDEVGAFIDSFGFAIDDPQNEGMVDGAFSKEGFLKGWNAGNEFGYSSFLRGENPPERVFALPGERLESIWRWNRAKAAVQESFGEDIFVPKVFFMAVSDQVVSVAVWPDAISELIPEVDFLFIGRDELAPKSFLGVRKKDEMLVPFSQLATDLAPYAISEYSLPAYKLPAPEVPENIRDGIRNLRPTGIDGEGIPIDQVLNEEIVAKFTNR